jgi:hypothetical protein
MNKVLLATLLTFVGLTVVADSFAFGRCGARRQCAPRSCEKQCAQTPVNIVRTEEKPCGPAPCCLTAVQVPASLVKHVEYSWECPTGCTVQSGEGY